MLTDSKTYGSPCYYFHYTIWKSPAILPGLCFCSVCICFDAIVFLFSQASNLIIHAQATADYIARQISRS